jgi:hypothetical protein
MHALLEDTLELLAGHITRDEAGTLLLPLCRAAAAFVRGADAAKDASGPDIWAEAAPWNLKKVRARVAEAYVNKPHRRLHVYVLSALALEVEKMRRAYVVQPVFDRTSDAPASILGCHKLVVLQGRKFWDTLVNWVRGFEISWLENPWRRLPGVPRPYDEKRYWVASHIHVYTYNRKAKHSMQIVVGVLRQAGLESAPKYVWRPEYDSCREKLLWRQDAWWAHGYQSFIFTPASIIIQ